MIIKGLGLVAMLASGGCTEMVQWNDGVRGSGKIVSESRRVSDFKAIYTQGAFDIDVNVGSSPSLKITGDDNLLKLVETKVENGTLMLTTKKDYHSKKGIKLYITVPRLTSFNLKGAGDVNIDGVREDKFTIDLRGAGDMHVNGTVRDLEVSLKGAGDLDLYSLKAENVRASLSGAGDMNVYASKYLKATVSGVGDLNYKGHPEKVEKSVTGMGDVDSDD